MLKSENLFFRKWLEGKLKKSKDKLPAYGGGHRSWCDSHTLCASYIVCYTAHRSSLLSSQTEHHLLPSPSQHSPEITTKCLKVLKRIKNSMPV